MKQFLPAFLILCTSTISSAQSLSPTVIASAGGSGTTVGVTMDWTVGETMTETYTSGALRITQGFHQADVVRVRIDLEAFLEGPYSIALGRMKDGMRTAGYVPLTEPYTSLLYTHVGGGGETTTAPVLAVTGPDAIIDWVFVELRDAGDNTNVLATRSALLQSDGDVVDTDGTSPLSIIASPASFYIAIHHRNHLAVMTASPVALTSTSVTIDLIDGSTATYGTDAQKNDGGTRMSWAGDVKKDGMVKYTGDENDRDPILESIGGVVPTATTSGYIKEDVNLDGTAKYTGDENDRDVILTVIGGVIPTNTRSEQMP